MHDVHVVGPPAAAAAAFTLLGAELSAVGLELSPAKCLAWAPGGDYGVLSSFPGLGVAEAGFPLLGVWLGPPAEMASRCEASIRDPTAPRSLARKTAALAAMAEAGFTYTAHVLLGMCAAPTADHIYRSAPPSLVAGAAATADRLVLGAFRAIAGVEESEMPDGSFAAQQASLPTSKGGPASAPPCARRGQRTSRRGRQSGLMWQPAGPTSHPQLRPLRPRSLPPHSPQSPRPLRCLPRLPSMSPCRRSSTTLPMR